MLDFQEKAAAWDKPESQLTPEEREYINDPVSYDFAQEGCFDLEKIGRMQHQSAWVDVERKAKRLLESGNVVLYHKRPYDLEVPQGLVEVSGNITGDHARYDAKIILPHPKSRAVRTWSCQCTWARYVWNRSPEYKRFEGRLCSHVLALWWMTFNLPVEYEDVKPEVLKYHLPEMAEQGRLFDRDEMELAELIVDKARISPGLAESIYGITLDILNKSINEAFDLVPAEDVIADIRDRILSAVSEIPEGEFNESDYDAIEDSIHMYLNSKTVYDTDESVFYKKEIASKIIEVLKYGTRMQQIDQRLRSIRATRTRKVDVVEALKKEFEELTAEKQQLLQRKPRIDSIKNDISYASTVLQEIYDNNIAAEKQPRVKAQEALNYFQWYEQNAPAMGARYAEELRRGSRPIFELLEEMQQEMIRIQSQMELPGTELPGVRVRTPRFQEVEEELLTPPPNVPGQMRMQTSVSVLSSNIPVKDIVFYIQNQVAQGSRIPAYLRREVWGEQRGGFYPHPDAQPIQVRNDGTFIYSADDLGYDPDTGTMGSDKEERGTYASIPIGSEVVILAIDPKERMVLVEFHLEGDAPNHSHIHIWVPTKDLDLI